MIAPQILHLCACIEGSEAQKQQLEASVQNFTHWDLLLSQAEEHGMVPLLAQHLARIDNLELPAEFVRSLRFLSLRHKKVNLVRQSCLADVLSLFISQALPSLVLKGAALANIIYPEVGLRPMRDIDLLLSKDEVKRAYTLLLENGFRVLPVETPKGYYHLPPLYRIIDGFEISIELHRGLFPADPPYYKQLDFADLFANAQLFMVADVTAYAMANEEMLYHLFQHGFRAPLTYEPFKLISAADIFGLVQQRCEFLDWEKIETCYPDLFRSLGFFDYLSPWDKAVKRRLRVSQAQTVRKESRVKGIGQSYGGWPQNRSEENEQKSKWTIFRATLFPSSWWLGLYYSANTRCRFFLAKYIFHPVHLLRWVKLKRKHNRKKESGRPTKL